MTMAKGPDPLLDPDHLASRSSEDGGSGRAEQRAPRADIDHAADEAHNVLLIHGQPGSSLIWTRVLPLLQSYGLRVLAIDRPGYGHTGGPAVDQFANAAAIAQVLEQLMADGAASATSSKTSEVRTPNRGNARAPNGQRACRSGCTP
jgi:pimeloyl-ACP methyl ester carboxylesterase